MDVTCALAVLEGAAFMGMNITTRSVTANFIRKRGRHGNVNSNIQEPVIQHNKDPEPTLLPRESIDSYDDEGSPLMESVPISCPEEHLYLQRYPHKPQPYPQELKNDKAKLENECEISIVDRPDGYSNEQNEFLSQIINDGKTRQPWIYVERYNHDSNRNEFRRIAPSQLDVSELLG
ncbi:hypothetical protein EDB82DRAFT_554595 [Fusarium venenatum]|nr:hypothetical protein EDB82DRAFT_554595 [Fusarium venenatum]